MKLRLRIALATIAVMTPMLGALVWLDVRAQQSAAEGELVDMVLARSELPGERERCEAKPSAWQHGPSTRPGARGGQRPPPQAADAADSRPPPQAADAADNRPPPRDPPPGAGAPPRDQPPPSGVRATHHLPAQFFVYDRALRSSVPNAPMLEDRITPSAAQSVTALSRRLQPDRAEVLVRTPWPDSPCAFVLARGTTEPWLGALLPPTRIWALPALMVLVTVLLAIGPVVRRIRVLTRAVQRSAAFDYAQSVPIQGDDEIAELARAFAAAGREVRTQLDAKDRREHALRNFVADTTHDVAIPLTVLQGHLATLQECLARGAPLDASALASAMSEAHYIGALLHNLAAAAKLDAADPELARAAVDLNALVIRVVSRHRPLALQHDVSIESAVPDGLVHTDADVTLLEQAVSNIVYNAVRYNRAAGHVAVLLETPSAGEFRIRVLDDGPGVPAETLARVSERGFRGTQARTRNALGQGLGLHISQRVVDAHGMRLQLSSPEAGGLQVDITGARSVAA